MLPPVDDDQLFWPGFYEVGFSEQYRLLEELNFSSFTVGTGAVVGESSPGHTQKTGEHETATLLADAGCVCLELFHIPRWVHRTEVELLHPFDGR